MTNNRYVRLSEHFQDKWIIGCPVEIGRALLLLDNQNQDMILQMTLRNVDQSTIKHVEILIFRYDMADDPLSGVEDPMRYTFMDLEAVPKSIFGDYRSIPLGSIQVRSVRIVFSRVVFSNGMVWRNTDSNEGATYALNVLRSRLSQTQIEQFDREYQSQYPSSIFLEKDKQHPYWPYKSELAWVCTCGFPNAIQSSACGRCSISQSWLFQVIDRGYLDLCMSEYLETEHIRLQEAKQAKDESLRIEQEMAKQARTLFEEQEASHKSLIKKRKKIMTVVLVTMTILAVSVYYLATKMIIPNAKYKLGKNMLAEGMYDEAIPIFESMDGYKDSADLILETRYQIAIDMLDEARYDEAITMLHVLKNYKNSADLIVEIQYLKAQKLLAEKMFDMSEASFLALGNYKDSVELVSESKYQAAILLINNGKFDEAIAVFHSLHDYKDSTSQITEANYQKAIDLLEKKMFTEALTLFDSVGEYKDSSVYSNKSKYGYANHLKELKKYDEAASLFYKLGDFMDSSTLAKECHYLSAQLMMEERSFTKAIAVFGGLDGYKDSDAKILEAKYQYARDNFSRNNSLTIDYLHELSTARYKDSSSLFKQLTIWKLEIIANSSKSDETTDLHYVTKNSKWYFHLSLTGGKPEETIQLSYTGYFPDGSKYSGSFDSDWSDGFTSLIYFYYTSPQYGETGSFIVKIFDKSTGQLLGSKQIELTD